MVHGGSKDRICHLIWRCMQQTTWKPGPYQVGVKGPDDRESRHITSLEVWMVLDSHTWFDTPNQVNAMHVMLTSLKCIMPPRCKTQQAICNYHDKMYDTKHTRYKHDANMEQIDHGIDMLQSLMEQICNKHGAGMQDGLKWQRGQALTLLKTVAKSA